MGTTTVTKAAVRTGARLLVDSLEAQGVKHIFGIPGAKIDSVFDTLLDSSIQTIVCRHEQNAAFIAGGIGRMTGKAGVVLVTSGPGVANLATGLATATSEGDPIVAIGGAVPLERALKQVHQSMDQVALLRPVTKFSAEIESADTINEVVANAFRIAESGRPGAAYINARQDIMVGEGHGEVLTPVSPTNSGAADTFAIAEAAELINGAERPVVLLGLLASQPENTKAVRKLLGKARLPVVGTYQAAGVVSRELSDLYGGRIGLFHTQPADKLLDGADLVVTVGYDPVEYEPSLWNKGLNRKLIHIDAVSSDIDRDYHPQIQLIGDIAATLDALSGELKVRTLTSELAFLKEIALEREEFAKKAADMNGTPVHPLRLVHELQKLLTDDTTLCSDMGSFHIWLARYLYSFRARQVLITNGQQTLGVALPWAIAASLVRPNEKVISLSGDGGFLFSAMELETAVRLKCNLVHIVWIDGSYDMVRFQQMSKYGRAAAVDFGPVDVVKYAEAFGAHGMHIQTPDEIVPTLKRALALQGPVLIGIPVDYRDNLKLTTGLHPDVLV
ncbi:acetolactate synthase AlsS [Edaphobacter aggregans]|uniref:acetolactate synthase AlsS n=1 Tax=Edaphobacter aggregans TaxID=570835 RepID=UPI0005540816|nr:acetolactate synthase AlsS [Edaphobacter aggregans]